LEPARGRWARSWRPSIPVAPSTKTRRADICDVGFARRNKNCFCLTGYSVFANSSSSQSSSSQIPLSLHRASSQFLFLSYYSIFTISPPLFLQPPSLFLFTVLGYNSFSSHPSALPSSIVVSLFLFPTHSWLFITRFFYRFPTSIPIRKTSYFDFPNSKTLK
jgi:hypothetical protein